MNRAKPQRRNERIPNKRRLVFLALLCGFARQAFFHSFPEYSASLNFARPECARGRKFGARGGLQGYRSGPTRLSEARAVPPAVPRRQAPLYRARDRRSEERRVGKECRSRTRLRQ